LESAPPWLPAPARFVSLRLLLPATFLRCSRSAKYPVWQIAQRRLSKLPRRSSRAFFSTVAVVAKQTRNRVPAAKKMDLKSVRLFLGARLCVDPPYVLF
jgi:hypothetical protein